jgi:hypothetical protein
MHLEDLYRLLRSELVQAQGIVDTLEEPLRPIRPLEVRRRSPTLEGWST